MGKLFLNILSLALLMSVAGCQSIPVSGPPARQKELVLEKPPRLAVALGGGGPKGYAHLGVIKAFEEAGLTPDLITGTSIGSLVGAWWAAGHSYQEILGAADAMIKEDPVDLALFARGGWIAGDKLEGSIRKRLKGRTFEDLKVPFVAMATNLKSGRPIEFSSGDLASAIRASCSSPGIFLPKVIEGESYIDGDSVSPLATEPALRSRADVIVAVDISNDLPTRMARTIEEIQERASEILRKNLIERQKLNVHFVIHPSSIQQFDYRKELDSAALIQNAYEETKFIIPKIKAALAKPKP